MMAGKKIKHIIIHFEDGEARAYGEDCLSWDFRCQLEKEIRKPDEVRR